MNGKSLLKLIFALIMPLIITLVTIGIAVYAYTLPRDAINRILFILFANLLFLSIIMVVSLATKQKTSTPKHIIIVNTFATFVLFLSLNAAYWI